MLRAMSVGHAGEVMAHHAVVEGGAGGILGLVLGAVLGWPHDVLQPIGNGPQMFTTYQNFWTHGKYSDVFDAGLFGAGMVAIIGGALGLALRALIKSLRSKPGASAN